jgi:hypothetical protein
VTRTLDQRRKQGNRFCKSCEHYNLRDDEPDAISGYCRRYPPTIAVEKSVSDGFPNVRPSDWCGEWKLRL